MKLSKHAPLQCPARVASREPKATALYGWATGLRGPRQPGGSYRRVPLKVPVSFRALLEVTFSNTIILVISEALLKLYDFRKCTETFKMTPARAARLSF